MYPSNGHMILTKYLFRNCFELKHITNCFSYCLALSPLTLRSAGSFINQFDVPV